MGRFLVMPAVGSCISMSTLPTGTAGPIAISKPVGQGPLARNLPDDVRTIQDALNRVTVMGMPGGPIPFLTVDGIKGPKTQAAILNFQKVQVKSIHADGLVEPGKQTILHYDEIVGPVSKFDLKASSRPACPSSAALAAAIQNLRAVITGGPVTQGPAAAAADRLQPALQAGHPRRLEARARAASSCSRRIRRWPWW